ncbi:MAG: GIY-YIG nuclease family protein [Candidatus Thorarchaeota archaeon]
MKYFVYIVQCSDTTLYTGYTFDLEKRINQHNSSNQGAKYTKMRRPVKLVYYEILPNQKEAIKREREIKKLSRDKKLLMVNDFKNNAMQL